MTRIAELIDEITNHIAQLDSERLAGCIICAIGTIISFIIFAKASKETSNIQDYTSGGLMPLLEAMILITICTIGFCLCWSV